MSRVRSLHLAVSVCRNRMTQTILQPPYPFTPPTPCRGCLAYEHFCCCLTLYYMVIMYGQFDAVTRMYV